MAHPIMVAVGGDSGSGKSTLCSGLEAIFGADRMVEVCLDDYHTLDRAQRKALGVTALDPRANDFAAMEEDLRRLARGSAVSKPVYDHADGTFSEPETIEPREIVIVQGLFPLYTPALRALFDITIWLDPRPELKAAWKVRRDTARRGYSEAEVRAEIAARRPDFDAHVAPQATWADLVVRVAHPDGAMARTLSLAQLLIARRTGRARDALAAA
jgi:phosphoribulokinase